MKLKTTNIPKEMKDRDQWVCWRGEKKDNGKLDKIPINPHTGGKARTNDPTSWGTFEQVLTHYKHHKKITGIGFVFTEGDPFVGVDLDDCIKDRQVEPWAKKILQDFNSYAEISPSGKGIKIFVKGKLPGGAVKTKHIEMYDRGRFFTVTGGVWTKQ